MSCNYAVTAYKPTSVTTVLTGNFTGGSKLNLILVRGNNLAVHEVTPEGLKSVVDASVRGRIGLAKLIRPLGETRDSLIFLTARYHLAVLSYDSDNGELVTRAYGNIKDRIGRPTEGEMLGVVDPKCTMMALHLYIGLIKVVPLRLDSGDELKAFNCRLEDLYAIDVQFLHGYEKPSIAYLAQEVSGRMLKTASISVKDKELVKGPWEKFSVESQASLLHPVPLPLGGVVVLGALTISYYNKEEKFSIDPPVLKESIVSCVGKVDNWRCLVGDLHGRLFMLFVESEERMNIDKAEVTGLRLEMLGETVSPSCLAYLDNGVVFIGSHYGDSQLVKLSTTADEGGSFIQVMEQLTNLGPILDMSVVDLDKQGQDLIISCSGYGKDGSLRIVRSGIGINELASIDLSGVKGLWSLHCGSGGGDSLDNTLVVSFVGHTTVLSLCGEEVEETEIAGLASDQQTFYCSNVTGDKVIQVTSQAVRLIRESDMTLISKWEPPDGKNISNVSCNNFQIVVAAGRELFYIEIAQGNLELIRSATMPYEVACVDVSPLGKGDRAEFCVVGLWTEISVSILRLPTLEQVDNQPLGGDIIPRSVLMVTFGTSHYLLCALGDGCLLYFQMQLPAGQLSTSKRVVLGTKPIVLKKFTSSGSTNVFACSNHPTIIYSNNQKILFSNVNLKEVNYLCTLNSDAFRESLAMVDDSTLTIGSVDQIQMLHIQTIHLGESARRITHQEETNTFAVTCSRVDLLKGDDYVPKRQSVSTLLSNLTLSPPSPEMAVSTVDLLPELDVTTVLLIDQTTFEALHGFQLLQTEQAVSIASCSLGTSTDPRANAYYVVGTALVAPHEREPKVGRILVFQVTANNTLQLVHTKTRGGAVYQLVPFNGMLVAAVHNDVQIMSWSEEEKVLEDVCSYSNNILALFVKTKGDFILVGDLLRSFKLLVYKSDEGVHQLEEIALDINLNPVFLSAIEMLDDETFLGADGRHIFLCQKNSVATVEGDLRYMQQPSRMYLGEGVNVFQRGSLVMEHPGSSPTPIIGKPVLYGGVHGTIGLIGQLKPEVFSLLMKLQNKMTAIIKSVGNIEHESYRSFANDHATKIAEGFIDGDLIEQFLDLPQNDMAEICKGIKVTDAQGTEAELQVDEVVKIVEDLSRLH